MTGVIFTCLMSYIIGSIPNGLILGKLIWNTDLREHGSHNIGATNAWRTIGKPAGLLIFALDLMKGLFGVWLGGALSGLPLAMVMGGIFAIVGHSWSLFLSFSGGKGVATGLGAILMMMPYPTILVFLVWFLIVRASGYVSLGSIIASLLVPVLAWLFGEPREFVIFGLIAAIFVIYRHKSNIGRLMNGTETKIRAAK